MRKLVEKLRSDIQRFIDQRDDFVMVVSCAHNDAAIVLQLLRDIESSDARDIFMLLADNFVQTNPFVSVAVERLREQHRMACEALAEQDRDPLPDLPSAIFNESQSAHDRLRDAITFTRSLMPRQGGHRLIWAVFPQQIRNRTEYLNFVSSFVPSHGVKPWMAGVRMIFRDETGTTESAPELAKAPRLRILNVDMGPGRIEASTREDIQDPDIPEEERMHALLTLAILDYAHGRTAGAFSKYQELLSYYQNTDNQLMQAFVINAVGDIFHKSGDLNQARHWYECAVPAAAIAKDPVILSSVTRNLGDVSYKLGDYHQAEQYYDGVDKLSKVTLDVGTKARALQWRGLSQEQQGKQNDAIESWEAAVLLCRNMNLPVLLRENLEHLRRIYTTLGLTDKARLTEAELGTFQLQGASS